MVDIDSISAAAQAYSQLGIAGAIICYCLYTDYAARKEAKAVATARMAADLERDKVAAKREEACIARVQALEDSQKNELALLTTQTNSVLSKNSYVIEAVLTLIERSQLHKTPLPQDDTTTLIKKVKDQ